MDELIAQAQKDGVQKLVVGAYVMRDDKILLIQRSATEDFLPNMWEIPSGGVDDGEGLIEALQREVFEETGLMLGKVGKFSDFFDYVSGSGRKARQFNFIVTASGAVQLNPVEHQAHVWVMPTVEAMVCYDISSKTRAAILSVAKDLV